MFDQLQSLYNKLVGPKVTPLTSSEFSEINSERTGILVKSVGSWYSDSDVVSIKNAYPVPEDERRGKITVFRSSILSEGESNNECYEGNVRFYRESEIIRGICDKMRDEILSSIPSEQRDMWSKSEWFAAIQWSNGSEGLMYDHVQHVHRDSIVASLTLEGSGTIAKILRRDISDMDVRDIYEDADRMEGCTYQAGPGELMIINAVHYPGGGLHAAPQHDGAYPERLAIFVEINRPGPHIPPISEANFDELTLPLPQARL